jgi:hypothetical protein
MTVYKGVLSYMSGGSSDNYSGGLIGRSFIEIGGNRINGVVLSSYQDEMLLRFVGQEVALSGVKQRLGNFQVFAIRTPNGEVIKRFPLDFLFIAKIGPDRQDLKD